jgi:hypothetical protein
MEIRFLPTPLQSGSVREFNFGVVGTGGVWVLFDSEDGHEAGLFPGGANNHSSALLLPGTSRAFLVTAGKGYSVDVASATVSFETDTERLWGAVALPVAHDVLAWDDNELFVYSLDGLVWRSGRLALDGLAIRSVNESKVEGALWDSDGWHEFVLTLGDYQVSRGEYLGGSWPSPPWRT